MIKIDNVEVFNINGAIRGMRNPLESWGLSDSKEDIIGDRDLKLAQNLVKAGSDECKFMRQIFVSMDITAPIYLWKELSTYKVATVANSTSTMHKLTSRPITIDDFSTDHMDYAAKSTFEKYIDYIESLRKIYVNGLVMSNGEIHPKDKQIWYDIIQMLPSSYNQTRTWTANYQVLRNIYHARKNHKLEEWRDFCYMIEQLPYAKELICI